MCPQEINVFWRKLFYTKSAWLEEFKYETFFFFAFLEQKYKWAILFLKEGD